MKLTVIPIVISALEIIPKGLVKGLRDLEIRGQVETIQTKNIIKIGQNTEKSPGDLKRLAVTQTPIKDHQLMLMWKLASNLNITKRGTQATGLGVMIGRCSLDSQHGRPDRHPTNVGCSFFRYMNDDIRNHNDQRPKRKIWTREDNHLALQCYFRSNPSQSGYRKRMIEIWQECASFQTTSQRVADQVRTIIKKDGFLTLKYEKYTRKHRRKTVQYQTHQVAPTKNNISEMNCQLLKMNTPQYQVILHYHKNNR